MIHTKHQKIRLDLFGESVSISSASTAEGEQTKNSGEQNRAESPSADRDPSGVIDSVAGNKQISDPRADEGKACGNAGINTQADSKTARRKAYDTYIKGEGREFFTEDMQNIVSKRIKDAKQLRARVDKLDPLADAVAKKYGIDPKDTDALTLAVLEDSVADAVEDSKTDIVADAKTDIVADADADALGGIHAEEAANSHAEEAEVNLAGAVEAAAEGDPDTASHGDRRKDTVSDAVVESDFDPDDLPWEDSDDANIGEHLFLFDGDHLLRIGAEAEEMKLQYPGFDLWAEAAADPIFFKLLGAGISVEEAYLARHHKEIVTRAVADARAETEKAVVDNIRARGMRPVEGGANAVSAPQTGYDVRNLTREQRAEIARQATIGKRIEFI